MSAKAQSLPVAVRPHIRAWQLFTIGLVLIAAVALALILANNSGSSTTPGPGKGVAPATSTQSSTTQVGGNSSFQYHPLP